MNSASETTATGTFQFKEIFRRLLIEKDVRITVVSRKTGIPRQTLYGWESGILPRDLNALKRLADYFEITLDELCFGIKRSGSTSQPSFSLPFGGSAEEVMMFEVTVRKQR